MILTSSAGPIAKLDGPVYRQARLWSITRTDGWNRKFTDHNKEIEFLGQIFKPMNGMSASASRRETSFKGQNFETIGVLSDSDITIDDLVNNRFDNARIQEWIVDWMFPFQGYFVYSTYIIRDHDYDQETWKAQVEGPMSKLEQTIGETYTPSCRRKLGGRGCNRILDSNTAPSNSITYYNDNGVVTGSTSVNGHPQLVLNRYNQPLGPVPYRNRWMVVESVRVATPPPGELNSNVEFYLNTSDIPADYSDPDPGTILPITVTMAVGSPGVVTAALHGFAPNTPVVLTTTGSLLTGLTPGQIYYVKSPTTNTFNLSATPGGVAIAFTGTQSGVHTVNGGTAQYPELQVIGGWFTYGRLEFETGDVPAGTKYEISFYDHPYGSPFIKVTLRSPLPSIPAVGDLVTLIAGCSKTWDHCRGKHGNPTFFGGFIFIPGPDRIYQRPGAI